MASSLRAGACSTSGRHTAAPMVNVAVRRRASSGAHAAAGVRPRVCVGAGEAAGAATQVPHPLVGQRYLLTLDIGREKHTWMDQRWAASGRRVEVPLAVEFQPGGVLKPLGVGAFVNLKVSDGEWTVDGATLRFIVPTGGLTRGDVSIPPGPLHGSVPVWGGQLSREKGSLTVMQTRWLVRTERRLVGRLRCAAIPPGDDVAGFLRPARVKSGSLDGPLYHQPDPESGRG